MIRMRARLLMVVVMSLLLGGWFDDPPSCAIPDGGPIDPDVFQRERIVCASEVSVFTGREDLWQATSARACGDTGTFPCVATSFPDDPHHTTKEVRVLPEKYF
jgi:hypothetical protein